MKISALRQLKNWPACTRARAGAGRPLPRALRICARGHLLPARACVRVRTDMRQSINALASQPFTKSQINSDRQRSL